MNKGDQASGRPAQPTSTYSLDLSSRIDKVTDDGPDYGAYDDEDDEDAADLSRWSVARAGSRRSNGYDAVHSGSASPPVRTSGLFGHGSLSRRTTRTLTEEDSIDMSLLASAAGMGTVEEEATLPNATGPLHAEAEPVIDISTSLGPMTREDEEFMKNLQEPDVHSQLTRGLGGGINTDVVMSESELLATSPIAEREMPGLLSKSLARSLTRTLTRRHGRPERGRTLRQIGQQEADRRGEVIEVIMEHTSEVDISLVSGPSVPNTDSTGVRRSTFPAVTPSKSMVFYPQPNWKPFSMKWPYLSFLISLSLILAGVMEGIYQASRRDALLTFDKPSDVPGFQYFAFKFLPTIVTVTYGVLWQITDFEVKRLEAFYQLSREEGALAATSINVDYITNFSFMRPFRAMQYRHYAVAVSSVASLLAVSLVPTLGTACIVLQPDRDTRQANPGGAKFITIQPVFSRLLTVTLLVIAALGCLLFYQLQHRRSGLVGDVKGIAGLAAMAVVSHILSDFKDMDLAPHQKIHSQLRDHRYMLRNASLAPVDAVVEQERDTTKSHLSDNPHPLMLRPAGVMSFVVAISLFLALIPVFLFSSASLLTEKAPWIVTFIAVCIKLSWGSLETDLRMIEPYYILSQRHAPAKTLALDYTAMPVGWVAFEALKNKHYLVFCVGFGTVMTEMLTVLITSLAVVEGRDFIADRSLPANATAAPGDAPDDSIDSGQETSQSFWITLGLASAILLYMAILASIVFARRRRIFLPRQPNTIASVLAFLHRSKMLNDFEGTAKYSKVQMLERLDGLKKGDGTRKTYGLGWYSGRDGQTHMGIDEEELQSSYRHGEDYSQSNRPWIAEQREWLGR